MSNDETSSDSAPIGNEAAEHLIDAYDVDADAASPIEAKAARMMTDDFLVRAYQRSDRRPGNAEGDALLAEIQRRGLAV